jgi:DNA polymerase (family 10)
MDCWHFKTVMKSPIPLQKARRYAEQIANALQPFCTRLEIAGSIRRERPFCGDIDIVAEPRDEAALRARILDGKEVVQNGPQNIHVRLTTGLEIQVFLARPETKDLLDTKPSNWGSLLLLRTGSREHNIFLTQTARANCAKWEVYNGIIRDGRVIASSTEEEIFAALHLKYVEPKKREIQASYHPIPTTPFGSAP